MHNDLTARQKQFLDFIESFIADRGYPPSIRETQKAFGLKSTKGVKDHIDRLVEKATFSGRTVPPGHSPSRLPAREKEASGTSSLRPS